MDYTINYSDSNKGTISIEDSTINQQTSLDIPQEEIQQAMAPI